MFSHRLGRLAIQCLNSCNEHSIITSACRDRLAINGVFINGKAIETATLAQSILHLIRCSSDDVSHLKLLHSGRRFYWGIDGKLRVTVKSTSIIFLRRSFVVVKIPACTKTNLAGGRSPSLSVYWRETRKTS